MVGGIHVSTIFLLNSVQTTHSKEIVQVKFQIALLCLGKVEDSYDQNEVLKTLSNLNVNNASGLDGIRFITVNL